MKVYLDASVIVPAFVVEDTTDATTSFLAGLAERPIVTSLAAGEVASAISRLLRERRLSLDAATSRLARFNAWYAASVETRETTASDVRLGLILVRRVELALRMPDAIHLATCQHYGLALATHDQRLVRAAGQLGVQLAIGAN